MKFVRITQKNIDAAALIYMDAFNNSDWNERWTFTLAKQRVKETVAGKNGAGFAYVHDGSLCAIIIGRYEVWYSGVKKFNIKEICVLSEHRNKGIATRLLDVVVEHLKKNNVESVWLLTRNTDALVDFYLKRGFIREQSLIRFDKDI